MGAVCGTEGIVDEHVERRGELLDESRLVLRLLLVEACVLEHDDVSLGRAVDDLLDLVADAVGCELDLLPEQFAHALGAGSEAELVLGTVLGAAQVRADGDDGALALQIFDGGDGRADACVVGDGLTVEGDVDIAADQYLLPLEVGLTKVLDRFLSLQFHDGASREGTDGEGGGGGGGEGRDGGEGEEGNGGVDELHG